MPNRPKCFRAIITVLGLLASVVAVQAALQGTAQARCVGGTVITTTLNNGEPVAYERPIRGTCDGNGFYAFQFRSDAVGWRASVWRQDNNGNWHGYFGGYDLDWHSDNYTDSNSWANMHLCLNHISNGNWWCGVGDNVVFTNGVNHTFVLPNTGF